MIKKKPAQRALLRKELGKLIPKMDEEGLEFLLKQARTIIYNLRVEELNRELTQAGPAEKKRKTVSRGTVKTAAAESAEKYGVSLEEAPGGSSFIAVLGSTRKAFSRAELRQLVALVHAGDEGTRGGRLFTWFKKHRGDVLFDARIETQGHPLLEKLARYLRTNFSLKK